MSHLGQSNRTTSREGVQWSYIVPRPRQMRVFEGLGAHKDVNTDMPKDVDMHQSKSQTDPPHSLLEV